MPYYQLKNALVALYRKVPQKALKTFMNHPQICKSSPKGMQASKGEYMAQWTDGNTFAHYSKRIKKGAQVKLCNTDKETPLMGEFEAVNERSPPSDALKGIEYGKKVLP